jgi:hypothetical protein
LTRFIICKKWMLQLLRARKKTTANKLWEQAEAKLADAEKRLTVTKGEKKDQGLLLETALQALSKREDSSVLMISTAVAPSC